jgi:osmotically-inducible protein OsmY
MRMAFLIGISLLVLTGCSQETIDSAKKDVDRNTATVRREAERVEKVAKPVLEVAAPIMKPVVEAAGKEVNKKTEQFKMGARVTAALKVNLNLPQTIRVDADPDGQGVKLRGTVETAEQKKLAERIAKDTLGAGKKVQNDLKIAPSTDKDKDGKES